jgi:multidrug efflux pump
MSLSSLSVRRPVLAMVMSILIVLFGLIGFTRLGVREFPSVDPPVITVTTTYAGANSEVIENQLTEPIEEAVNRVEGIRSLNSVSRDGASSITVEFGLDTDLEAAANDVRDKVSQAVELLPPDSDPPVVTKSDANSFPIILLSLKSKGRNIMELSEYATNVMKERFQTVPGVSDIQIWGQKKYAMRLWMDADRLAAYGLTPLDVRDALNKENVELPTGQIEGANIELTVRTLGRMSTPQQFNELIIKETGGRKVRFQDVGYAEIGPENPKTAMKRDGVYTVTNAILARPGSNNIEIADEVYRRLAQIRKDLPADVTVDVGFDMTQYIRDSIREVQQTVLVAFILVVCIIFFFLRDWRTTLIPVIVIPISIIGAFFALYLMGYTINVLTMLGVVLAIGLVVDDAVVVLENIYAKIEQGISPLEAALQGSKEIFFAVIATTVALIAVFLPVIFLEGLTGRLFREFGVTIASAVVISSFVALTLTPMLCANILKKRERHTWLYRQTEGFFNSLTRGYEKLLLGFMKVRWLAFVIMLASAGLIYQVGNSLPSEMAPLEDRNWLMAFSTAPEGTTFDYMDRYMGQLVELIEEKVPERTGVFSLTSPSFGAIGAVNSGMSFLNLKAREDRERSQQEIAAELIPAINELTTAMTFVNQPATLGGPDLGLPVALAIQAPDFEKLKEYLPKMVEAARADPAFAFVDIDLRFNRPEISISIDREKARSLGVSTQDIAQTLQLGYSGQRFGYFIRGSKQYQIIGQMARSDRNEPLDLRSMYVRNRDGRMIQLDNLVRLEENISPPQRFRYNRFVSAKVSAVPAPGKTQGEGIAAMQAIADRVLDDSFSTALVGSSKEFSESSSSLNYAFMLALILIYLVLSAQFESFRDPLIIMFTVPLALAGALVCLWYFDQSINIFSQIGIIMLIGLVSKNGILIVEFANQKKAQGLSRMEAITEASVARFRPILMTSLSTILGVLPIALALGAGAESRISMGIAVIGGLAFATVLTLLVIPAVYSYLSEKEKSVSNVS